MTAYPSDPQASFRLKPIRVARVSEISESTAAAMIPDDERVNFHIGNPVQDVSLSSAYLRMALGIDIHREELSDTAPEVILEYLGWDAANRPKLDFLIQDNSKKRTLYAAGRLFPKETARTGRCVSGMVRASTGAAAL